MQHRSTQLPNEPLLQEARHKKYTLFPIARADQALFKAYKHHLALFWTVDEIDFSKDKQDFQTLPSDVQTWIKHILAFFSSSDLLIIDNLMSNVICNITNTVCQLFYSVQLNIESIHSECYSLLIQNIIEDETEQSRLFNAIEQMPVIKRKADFCLSKMSDQVPFSTRLFVFGLFEGVAFCSSFAGIFAIMHAYPGKMPALVTSNRFISRDESLHADFAGLLYRSHIKNKLSDEEAHNIVRELLKIERTFCEASVPSSLISVKPSSMVAYVEYCADMVLKSFGHPPLYNHKELPLKFMHLISLNSKSNFFEQRETSYSKQPQVEALSVGSDF